MHFTLKSYIYGIVIYNERIWSSLHQQYLKLLKGAKYFLGYTGSCNEYIFR